MGMKLYRIDADFGKECIAVLLRQALTFFGEDWSATYGGIAVFAAGIIRPELFRRIT